MLAFCLARFCAGRHYSRVGYFFMSKLFKHASAEVYVSAVSAFLCACVSVFRAGRFLSSVGYVIKFMLRIFRTFNNCSDSHNIAACIKHFAAVEAYLTFLISFAHAVRQYFRKSFYSCMPAGFRLCPAFEIYRDDIVVRDNFYARGIIAEFFYSFCDFGRRAPVIFFQFQRHYGGTLRVAVYQSVYRIEKSVILRIFCMNSRSICQHHAQYRNARARKHSLAHFLRLAMICENFAFFRIISERINLIAAFDESDQIRFFTL